LENRVIKRAVARVKRATKEILGLPPSPRSFEEQIYYSLVQRNDICYDVGAHAGEVSMLMARLAGSAGRVLAFEPVWPMYTSLCARVQRIANATRAPIVTLSFGLFDEEKVATLQVPSGDFGMGSLANAGAWAKAQSGADIASYECRFIALDDFFRATKPPAPDFMKIDVEGAELFVIRGAGGLFASGRRPLMLIEIFAPWERAFGYGPWELLSILLDLGYRFLFVCPDGLVEHTPSAVEPFPAQYAAGYNVLAFCLPQHAERIERVASLRVGGGEKILYMAPPPVANTLT
jgi:FkbM family methyltransferase